MIDMIPPLLSPETRIARVRNDWTTWAGENIEIEVIGGALYAFGSELATLRLYHKYRGASMARAGYSVNMGYFYFSLETSL